MIRRLLLPPLAVGALWAQTAVLRTLRDQEALATLPPATLVILEPTGGRLLSEGFSRLLQTPEMRVFQVPVKNYSADAGPLKTLVARYHLHLSPQWLLLRSEDGDVLARGIELPTAAQFAQALEGAGFRDRAKELKAYLKRNPEEVEARDQLIDLLRRRGEVMTQQELGMEVPSALDRMEGGNLLAALRAEDDPGVADLRGAKALSPLQDLEAWSAFTQELDGVFRNGQWRELGLPWTRDGRPVDSASPTLQGLYLRWLPTVEEALREAPESDSLWQLWVWMSHALGGRPLGPLIASLRPSPLTSASEWPPALAMRQLLSSAQTPLQWRELKTHFLALWEDEPHALRDDAGEKTTILFERDWDQSLGPLLQCCMKAGDNTQADAIFRAVWEASHWAPLRTKAMALATQCGQPALSQRWATLQERGAK